MVLVPAGVLTVLGLMMTLSASMATQLVEDHDPYAPGINQLKWAAVGVCVGFVMAHCHRWLGNRRRIAPILAAIVLLFCLAAQAMTLFGPLACDSGGNYSWLCLSDSQQIQPGEFLKLAIAYWLAVTLSRPGQNLDYWRQLIWPAGVGVAVAGGLVLAGRDAGTGLILGIMSFGTLAMAVKSRRKLAVVAVPLVILGAVLVLTSSNRRDRFLATYVPALCEKLQDFCYQVEQASLSMATGGWLGQGLGASRAKWSYLTQADTDFIFAIITEEIGLVSAIAVMVLYGVMAFGFFQLVRLHPNQLARLGIAAVGCWIIGQALVNIGMVVRLLPVIGVPLPFVSRGGSALISCLIAIGLVAGLMRTDPKVRNALSWRARRVRRAEATLAPLPVRTPR
jgi:cell division protein FtsW